jgi:hypothetical protein
LVVQSAVLNKPANVNAFFILKSKQGHRDYDPPSVNVYVAVQSVMVKDHGTDEQWAGEGGGATESLDCA